MSTIYQAENLDDEQLEFINNEYFSGFKRYKNWQTLPPKLKRYLPVYIEDKSKLQVKVEERTNTLKTLISFVYSIFSEIANNDKIDENMDKLTAIHAKLPPNEEVTANQKKIITAYFSTLNETPPTEKVITVSDIITDLKKRHQDLKNIEAQLRQAENTLNLCLNLINQFIDDKDGISFKQVKKSTTEIDKELKELKVKVEKKKEELKKIKNTEIKAVKENELQELLSDIENINLYKSVRVVRDAKECEQYLRGENFSNSKITSYEEHCSKKLLDIINDVQTAYSIDSRPWVLGYSGGKDSSAVATLVYLAMLAMQEEKRTKDVYLVASDTLVETPKVVEHIDQSLALINNQAARDSLPLTTHKVMPLANQSFWACLLGRGYPAPTKNFRWCTERMKIDPVSDFIKNKISQHNEVIVTLGSRSEESASRAQVIAKHKIKNSRFARHTTLDNAFIYTPIDTWSMDDVWKILRACSLEVTISQMGIGKKWANTYELEWENPWGAKNLTLWNLYKDSSDQGECPMVIDDSTPSCGNSRFGCWTCTVVNKDRAMESLIKNGEDWMLPLLKFRDLLAYTNIPANKDEFRNYKRRLGRVQFQRAKEGEDLEVERAHVPGPYWLKFRKKWLKELLIQEKQFNEDGHKIELITEPELHAIRQEWLNDPNEPDWDDSLPGIYREVYGKDLNWVYNDNSTFDKQGAHILTDLGQEFNVVPQMVMKLLDLEISMEGLSRRSGVQKKVETILKQDWGTLEEIKEKQKDQQSKANYDVFQNEISALNDKLNTIDKLLKKGF